MNEKISEKFAKELVNNYMMDCKDGYLNKQETIILWKEKGYIEKTALSESREMLSKMVHESCGSLKLELMKLEKLLWQIEDE